MSKVLPQNQVGESPGEFVAGAVGGKDIPTPDCLLREAVRCLEATDLPGANETLKKVEKALTLREDTNV